jgi:hypothetical protein
MPGARVEWLPVVGHTPAMDDPQSTGKLLLDYAEAIAPTSWQIAANRRILAGTGVRIVARPSRVLSIVALWPPRSGS